MQVANIFPGNEESCAAAVLAGMARHRSQYHFCLLTQQRTLAAETLRTSKQRAEETAKSTIALRIGDCGGLDRWELDARRGTSWRAIVQSPATTAPSPVEPYRLCTGTPPARDGMLPPSVQVHEGNAVVDGAGRRVQIGEQVGSGGEGAVFTTDQGLICKVFSGRRRTVATRDKLALMVSRPVEDPAICWPKSLVTDERGNFVGYLMKRARGKSFNGRSSSSHYFKRNSHRGRGSSWFG